jgi:hypothetical protein
MASRLLSRVRELERANLPSDWLVFDAVSEPSPEQIELMRLSHAAGRMAICFIEAGNTLWMTGMDEPWLDV